MTGFGRAEGQVGSSYFTIEVKSVNHRYLDTRFRLPSALSLFEIPLADVLRSTFERGAFEITVKHKVAATGASVSGSTRFIVDELAARSLVEGCEWLSKTFGTEQRPSIELMIQSGRVFLPVEDAPDTSVLADELKTLFAKALADLRKMRELEGDKLKAILKQGAEELLSVADELEKLAVDHPKRVQEKLMTRLAQWKLKEVDAQRLEWEVAFYADRAAIDEEIARLKTHARQFLSLLEEKKGVGRKLDFLTQELHREVNTVGSKATAVEITQLTVRGKTAIEKLREQVQNVE